MIKQNNSSYIFKSILLSTSMIALLTVNLNASVDVEQDDQPASGAAFVPIGSEIDFPGDITNLKSIPPQGNSGELPSEGLENLSSEDVASISNLAKNFSDGFLPEEITEAPFTSSVSSELESADRKFVEAAASVSYAAYRGDKNIDYRDSMGYSYSSFGSNKIEGVDGDYQGGLVAHKINKETGRLEIVVSFRGTEGGLSDPDWKANLNAHKAKTKSLMGSKLKVHKGFLNRYLEFRESVIHSINNVLIKNGLTDFDNVDLIVTGHSLGGGQASIAAVDLKSTYGIKNVKLITFAQPRVYGKRSSKKVTEFLGEENIIRVWRYADVVAGVSPGFLGYSHIGHQGGYMIDERAHTALNPNRFVGEHSMSLYLDHAQADKEYKSYAGSKVGKKISDTTHALGKSIKNIFKAPHKLQKYLQAN